MGDFGILIIGVVDTFFAFFVVAPMMLQAASLFGVQKQFAKAMVQEGVVTQEAVDRIHPKKQIAGVVISLLLLAVRGGDTLITLDDSLNQLASVAAGQAKSVSSTATAVYLLTASGVESYGYDGTHNWSRDYGAAPQAVINARETLVFISGTVEVLNAPHE